MTTSYDRFLDQTEPFYEAHPDELRGARGVTAALHTLIICGRELTVANMIRLLMRAGLVPEAEVCSPQHCLNGVACYAPACYGTADYGRMPGTSQQLREPGEDPLS
jgi:hypothetical protein